MLWVPGVEVKTRVGAQMLRWLYSIESPFSPSSNIAALASTVRTFSLFEKNENASLSICAWVSLTFSIFFFLLEIARLVSTVCPLSPFPHNVTHRPFRIEGRFCCYLQHFLLLWCASVVNSNQICVRASRISPGVRFSSSFLFSTVRGSRRAFFESWVFFFLCFRYFCLSFCLLLFFFNVVSLCWVTTPCGLRRARSPVCM